MKHTLDLEIPKARTLTDEVETSIRSAIFSGKLRPGQRLVEAELAKALRVSRIPVREAIQRLQQMGIVTSLPRKGSFVSQISLETAADVFGVRRVLETLAARSATNNLTDKDVEYLEAVVNDMDITSSRGDFEKTQELDNRFHQFLIEKSNRPFLIKVLEHIRAPLSLYLAIVRLMDPTEMENFAARHALVLQAIKSRDPDQVEAAVNHHISIGEEIVLRRLKEYIQKQNSERTSNQSSSSPVTRSS